jgi:hypothetical protein
LSLLFGFIFIALSLLWKSLYKYFCKNDYQKYNC